MKKLLLFFATAALALTTGCDNEQHTEAPACLINYVYRNESSSQITMTIHSDMQYRVYGMDDYYKSIINVGEHRTIMVERQGRYGQPFFWMDNDEYIEISNGNRTIIQSLGDELFLLETYTDFVEIKRQRTAYLYFKFTDEFFENGEPIEQ
jgi:hypothetical protein